jgi:hypothetical protein
MQRTLADFELQFRTLVKRSATKGSPSTEKSAYHTDPWTLTGDNSRKRRKRRKRKRRHRRGKSSNLAELGANFFADFGKPTNPLETTKLSIQELEEKRLSLPFIDTIEFVRLQLARRGIQSREKEPASSGLSLTKTTTTIEDIEDIEDNDFKMDLSEFTSMTSRQKVSKQYTSAKDILQNMTEEERRNAAEGAATTGSTFSELLSRARFPIFTDHLGPLHTNQQNPSGVSNRPIPWLLQLIEEIYDARYCFDCAQKQKQLEFKAKAAGSGLNRPPPLNTPDFIYTQLETQLGLKQLVDQTSWDMLYNMERCVDVVSWPEVDLFRNVLRELITSEHLLFFLHCRHIIQTEHEITFASRSKMNVTTCAPGTIMSSDPIGRTAGTCMLTQHPLVHDNKTKHVWLSIPAVRQVMKKILFYDDLTDYMMDVRTIGKTLIPTGFRVTDNQIEPQRTTAKEESSNQKDINGINVKVINTTELLNALMNEMQRIPKDKQVQFKNGDDSETVVLLAALQETERNSKFKFV